MQPEEYCVSNTLLQGIIQRGDGIMPSTYAHRYFGEKVRSQLTGRAAEIIDLNRELFDIGLQGPDI